MPDSVDDILYGDSPRESILSREVTLDGGAVETYDQLGHLTEVHIPRGGSYTVEETEIEASAGRTVVYLEEGQLHRTEGPAIMTSDGSEQWWSRGQKHRMDGPAVTTADGEQEYWWFGEQVDGKKEIDFRRVTLELLARDHKPA